MLYHLSYAGTQLCSRQGLDKIYKTYHPLPGPDRFVFTQYVTKMNNPSMKKIEAETGTT